LSARGDARAVLSAAWETWALVLGAALVVAVEFMVVGLSPSMAQAMRLSPSEAGWFVTAFALGSAVMGPFAAVIAHRVRADHAMVLALLPFGADILAPVVQAPLFFYGLRFVQGAMLPLFIGVASQALSQILAREDKAVARVYLGVTVGGLFGGPCCVAMADELGWPAPFVVLGGLSAAVSLVIAWHPRLKIQDGAESNIVAQMRAAIQPAMLAHLMLSLLQFATMFCTYAFLGVILVETGQGGAAMPSWLLVFGLGGIVGNSLGGYAAARSIGVAAIAVAALAAIPGLALLSMPLPPAALFSLLLVWGTAHAAAFVVCQIRVTRAAVRAPRLAAAMNISAANLGIALDSALGGWILAAGGLVAMGLTGFGLGLVSVVLATAFAWRR
jgi:predicted MFS family arabinose efflux permease